MRATPLNSMLIKEINTILKCKCALHSFNFVEEEQGWTDNINALDPSLFYHDKLYVIQKGNIKLSESNYNSYRRQKYWSKYSFQQDVKQET